MTITIHPPKSSDTIISDNFGNNIVISDGGKNISLKLKAENKKREIGTINLEERYLEVKRIKAKHLFRKTNSYGFNHYILSNAKKFDKVMLSDDDGRWLIPIKLILEKGHFLHFKNDGFELQIFLSLDIITNLGQDCTYF
jgi:hypothetical protein